MRTIIHENERGILTKNGRFVRVLGAGKWRTFGGSAIETLGVDRRSIAAVQSVPMSVLEKDAGFCAQALTVDVHDGEYVLHFTDGVFYELLTVPGRYFFWKDACEHAFRQTNVTSPEPDEAFPRAYFANIPSRLYSTVEVGQRERAALYFDGKFVRFLDPGVYYFWNRETLVTSVRYPACVVQREIPGQEILTADKVTLRINCVCDYEIADFERIAAEVDDYGKQLHTATEYTADIDVVGVPQAERTQLFSIDFRTGDNDVFGNELAVYGVPVDVLLVPIPVFLFTEQDSQTWSIFFGGDDQKTVIFSYNRIRSWNTHGSVMPQTRDDKL